MGSAFISAGENDADKNSMFLGNIDIIGKKVRFYGEEIFLMHLIVKE